LLDQIATASKFILKGEVERVELLVVLALLFAAARAGFSRRFRCAGGSSYLLETTRVLGKLRLQVDNVVAEAFVQPGQTFSPVRSAR
jgi:hypothetical protein